MSKLQIPTAEVFLPFLENIEARNHAAFGGRGGMKSHYFAGALIEEHLCHSGFRSVCIREIQKTLGSSSKQLLEDKLREFKLTRAGQGFKIFNDVIQTPGDGIILFQGMQDHTADSIKSLEGIDLAWIEEAQTITERSLNMLRPTIRKKGSRLWFGWNPRRKTDAVDKFFRSAEQPTNSVIIKTGWQNNPWWTAELEQERLDDLRMNPEQYDHIWEGGYISVATGAYFAKHIQQARLEKRIGKVNADPLLRKYAFVDIGGTGANSDAFTMWIVQFVAKEIRVLNYYEVIGQPLASHVAWLRANQYEDATIVLPHDGRQHDKVYKVTYESSFKDLGFNVIVIPNQGAGAASQRIEAVRSCFHDCYFDEEKCAAGLEALGWYHEKKDENRNVGLGPDHDWSSHGCLIAGTMINTFRGLIPIEDVFIGDEVMTPAGFAKVENAGISKISTELIEITLSDGRYITMTPEHKVFTTKGVFIADTLGYNDSIFTIEDIEWIRLANASNVGYRDAFIENLRALGIGTGKKEGFIAHKKAVSNGFYTESYLAILPIKKSLCRLMETGKTLIFQTGKNAKKIQEESRLLNSLFKSFKVLNITESHRDTINPIILNTEDNYYIGLSGSITMEKFQRDSIFTIKTRINQTILLKTLSCYQQAITQYIMQKIINGLVAKVTKNSLLMLKNWLSSGIKAKKESYGTVRMEKKYGKQDSLLIKNAFNADVNTKPSIQTDQCIAVKVVKVRRFTKETPVYDLTVKKHHCYFANGLLVSNSDSFGLMAIARDKLSKPRDTRKIALINNTPSDSIAGY